VSHSESWGGIRGGGVLKVKVWWKGVQLHSQEGQDFSEAVSAPRLITDKSSESRSLDLTNNGNVSLIFFRVSK
jgi:hypothetical protein